MNCRIPVYKIFIFSLCLIVVSLNSHTQVSDCLNNYATAINHYNFGNIDTCLKILQPCLEDKSVLRKSPKDTRIGIYRLAALSSILLDKPDDAENYINGLLSVNPDYQVTYNDFEEFIGIIENSVVRPKHSIGIKTGICLTQPKIETLTPYTDEYFQIGDGYYTFTQKGSLDSVKLFIGISYEYFLLKRLSVISELNRYNYSLNYEYKNYWPELITLRSAVFNFYDLPVIIKYSFLLGSRLNLFVMSGINYRFGQEKINSLLYGDEMDSKYGLFGFDVTADGLNIGINIENLFGLYGIAGCGFSYRIKSSEFALDMRCMPPIKKTKEISGSFQFIDHNDPIYYSDLVINLHRGFDIQFSASYKYNLNYRIFEKKKPVMAGI